LSLIDILPIAMLGALLGMDVVTFPQAMISRPIVAATIAGAFIGHPMAGLMIGAVLELMALGMLPFGASKYPEWGSASVVGGALYAARGDAPGALAASVLVALLTAVASGWSMIRLRRINASRAGRERLALDAGSSSAIIGLQVFGLTADFVRGGIVTFVAMLIFRPVVGAILESWSGSPLYARAVVATVASAVAAGAIWKIFHSVPRARVLFLAGVVVGVTLVVTR
jgi:mannose/fructose/N-acetylgalactosamine-specific phosphotransferase system component IIC